MMQWESSDVESTDSMNSEYSYQSGCESESDDGVTWEDTDDSDYIPHHLPESLKIVSRGSIAIRSVVVDSSLRPGQVKKQDCNTFLFGDGYECCSLSHTDRLSFQLAQYR